MSIDKIDQMIRDNIRDIEKQVELIRQNFSQIENGFQKLKELNTKKQYLQKLL